jgi:hypothetical protein
MLLLFISILIFALIVFFMPKHLSIIEYYTTTTNTIILQVLTDLYLGYKYHLYGYFSPGIDWLTLLVMFFIFLP